MTAQGRPPLAARLRQLRAALGKNQDEMGKLLGVTREWIGKLEREQEDFSEFVLMKMDAVANEHAREVKRDVTSPSAPEASPSSGNTDALRGEARRLFDHVIAATRDDPARLGWVVEQLRIHLRKPETWEEPETPQQMAKRLGLPTMGRPSQHLGTEPVHPTVPQRKIAQ